MLGQILLNSYYRERPRIKSSAKPVKTEYDFPKISEEELEKIKIEIRIKIKKQKERELVLSFFFTAIFFGIVYLLYKNI